MSTCSITKPPLAKTSPPVEPCHSTARQAALLARSAGVKRLVIGHYSSRYSDEQCLLDEARQVFPDTLLANEGMTLQV